MFITVIGKRIAEKSAESKRELAGAKVKIKKESVKDGRRLRDDLLSVDFRA